MKAIILAAGYATRLYPLTLNTPKALLPIGKKPIIDYIVDEINGLPEVDGIFVVSNDKFYNGFMDWVAGSSSKIPVKVLNDGTTDDSNKKGAIGDIAFTINSENIDDELLIIAGDNFFTFSLKEYYDFYKSTGGDCVCAKIINDAARLRQMAVAQVDEQSRITVLEEKPAEPKSNLAVYAAYFYKKETVPLFEKYLSEGNKPDAPGYFPEWLYKRGDVFVYKMNGECFDIGTPEMYAEVNRIYGG